MSTDHWHASPQREADPFMDRSTGEVRIPLDLFDLDELQAQVLLVLSRREAEDLRDALDAQLAPAERHLVGVRP